MYIILYLTYPTHSFTTKSFRKTFIFIKAISSKTLFYLLVVRITFTATKRNVLKLKIILINASEFAICNICIFFVYMNICIVNRGQHTLYYNNISNDFHHYHMHCTVQCWKRKHFPESINKSARGGRIYTIIYVFLVVVFVCI